jgi:uroporphyrinogen decarboxylase
MPSYPVDPLIVSDTAKGHEDLNRTWQNLSLGPIQNWEDFERYPWPEITDDDFYIHRYICSHLPEGMGFISCHAGGVYEHSSRLLGYEQLCYKVIDEPDLVKAVADKVGDIVIKYNTYLLELDKLVAVLQGEDFGFNTQTLLSPEDIKKYYLPWHKKFAAQLHEGGKPYYFHSCGKIDTIIDDLIYDVKIDGKHSFMEGIAPVSKAKKLYGDKICLLGGVDVNNLTILQPEDLRAYVRGIIDTCAPGGKFALGAGNSIPSYIPVENYLIMIDEALKY